MCVRVFLYSNSIATRHDSCTPLSVDDAGDLAVTWPKYVENSKNNNKYGYVAVLAGSRLSVRVHS